MCLMCIEDRRSVNILRITVNKRCCKQTAVLCDREREWSRVHPAIVSLLINDALDAREQTGYARIRSVVVVVVVAAVKRKNVNR